MSRAQTLTDAVITVDGWIKLAVPARVKEPLLEARRRLDSLFSSWVADRGAAGQQSLQQQGGEELLTAVVQLLSIQSECAPTVAAQSLPQQGNGVKRAWSGGGSSGGEWK